MEKVVVMWRPQSGAAQSRRHNHVVSEPVRYLLELHHGQSKEGDKLLLILIDTDACNLCQTLQSHIPEHWNIQKLENKTRTQN